VVNAVRSALGQTLRDIEVVVVMDGFDPATEHALLAIDDARLRIHVRPTRGGQGAAINAGLALARGEWTALLDDDDEWLAEKLERQLRAAQACPARNPVVVCRFIARTERADMVWPLRPPNTGEPVCEYLFCRHRLAFGDGIIPTSMIFARTALFRAVPMNQGLRRHCDLDWLVRADRHPDVRLELAWGTDPLAIWHMQQDRQRMSNNHDWQYSYAWLEGVSDIISPRAYAGFLLTWVSFSARREGELRAFPFLLRKAIIRGRPSLAEVVVHLAIWAVPQAMRQRLSRALATPASPFA
jgi:glycosyltransferase involved in cell wall biosynthesis